MEATYNLSRLKHVKEYIYIYILYMKEMGILLKVTSKADGSNMALFSTGDLKSIQLKSAPHGYLFPILV